MRICFYREFAIQKIGYKKRSENRSNTNDLIILVQGENPISILVKQDDTLEERMIEILSTEAFPEWFWQKNDICHPIYLLK